MQFSRNDLLMTDHVFLRIMQLKCLVFNLPFWIAFITVSRIITATRLFLQFAQYLSSFVGTPKNEIPGAVLELCQLKIKQFSPEILKFSIKHENNPFTLNCYMVPPTFLFIFHAGSRRLGSNNVWNSRYKEKTTGPARVSGLSFRFLWLWWNILCTYIRNVKVVMHGPYCIHIWHLNLPCSFAEKFPARTWRVLVKSNQIVCITHLIMTHGGINGFVKLEGVPISFDFLFAVYKKLL